jgi:hypothetical protein
MRAFPLLLCASLAACTAAALRVAPQACPSIGIDPATLVAASDQPKPIELFLPPLPIPPFDHSDRR